MVQPGLEMAIKDIFEEKYGKDVKDKDIKMLEDTKLLTVPAFAQVLKQNGLTRRCLQGTNPHQYASREHIVEGC